MLKGRWYCFDFYFHLKLSLFPSCLSQWEGKVTQYERDFDRISVTVRKEFLRFEVRLVFFAFEQHRAAVFRIVLHEKIYMTVIFFPSI